MNVFCVLARCKRKNIMVKWNRFPRRKKEWTRSEYEWEKRIIRASHVRLIWEVFVCVIMREFCNLKIFRWSRDLNSIFIHSFISQTLKVSYAHLLVRKYLSRALDSLYHFTSFTESRSDECKWHSNGERLFIHKNFSARKVGASVRSWEKCAANIFVILNIVSLIFVLRRGWLYNSVVGCTEQDEKWILELI